MNMQKPMVIAVLVITALLGALAAPRVEAQPYPKVSNLKPFKAESNYMSLPGFLRFIFFVESGVWISHAQAVRNVH